MKEIPLIIARLLLRVAKKEELETLSKWERASERNAQLTESLKKYWDHQVDEVPHSRLKLARERLFARMDSREEMHSGRTFISYFLRIAAILVFIISISGLSIYIASRNNLFNRNNWVEVSTEAGQQSKVTLPDGSLVWLNAETVVKYHSDKNERKVSLKGEAYFEVTHSSDYPFIVETGNTKVKVLGTKFNVSHYPDSKITEASLLSGKIKMSVNGGSKEVELVPGEKIVYDAEQQVLLKKEFKVQNDILWKQGILVFDNEPFNELVQKLERYYAVKFIYEKNAFENIHYTGSIDNLNISKVIEFMNLTIPISYEIDNKTIKLKLVK